MLRENDDVKVEYFPSEWETIQGLRLPLDVLSEVIRQMERSRSFAEVLMVVATRNKHDWEDVVAYHDRIILLFRGRMAAHFNTGNYNSTYVYNIDDLTGLVDVAHAVSRVRYRPKPQGFVDEFILAMNGWHGIIRHDGYVYTPPTNGSLPQQPPLPVEYEAGYTPPPAPDDEQPVDDGGDDYKEPYPDVPEVPDVPTDPGEVSPFERESESVTSTPQTTPVLPRRRGI